MEKKRVPWWLWPNLLSLDAPLVALAWAWMFSKAWGVRSLPWELWVTLGVSVWIVYALDRIIDARRSIDPGDLETRHRFHKKYAKVFMAGIFLGGLWCIHSVLFSLAQTVLQYGLFVILCSGVYFALTLNRPRSGHAGIGKNLVAGLTFAYGASAGVHAYSPILPFGDMVFSSEVLLFAAFCVFNMTAIDFWQLEGEEDEDAAAVLNMGTLLIGGIAMFIYMSTLKRESIFFYEDFYHEQAFYKPFAVGLLVGAASLFLLNQARRRFEADAYRVLVDVAVVAPVFVFWVMIAIDGELRT
jgi:hypothetical protein|tara:strand:+ start:59 stop:955 length:897 start_codon:yes stop_codon:yes gene_type:complete